MATDKLTNLLNRRLEVKRKLDESRKRELEFRQAHADETYYLKSLIEQMKRIDKKLATMGKVEPDNEGGD